MAKFLDALAATFVIFMLTLAVAVYLAEDFITGLAVAFMFALVFNFCLQNIRKKEHDKRCSVEDLYRHFLKNGQENAAEMLKKLFPGAEVAGNTLILKKNGKTEMVFLNYKFGVTTGEDVARFARAAKGKSAETVYILGKSVERSTVAFAESYENLKIIFIPHKKLYAVLKKKNLLPEVTKTRVKKKIILKELFLLAVARQNFKRYLFVGLALAVCSFLVFTLKIYYLSMACVCLALAFLCLTGIGERAKRGRNGVFDDV